MTGLNKPTNQLLTNLKSYDCEIYNDKDTINVPNSKYIVIFFMSVGYNFLWKNFIKITTKPTNTHYTYVFILPDSEYEKI